MKSIKLISRATRGLQVMLLTAVLFTGCKKDEENPTPGTSTVSDIDGNVYHTVTIGNQIWMVENLKTTRYRNGDPITNATGSGNWSTLVSGAYCNYNNDSSLGDEYGRLYNWYAVNDSRLICPAGWHVATDYEYHELMLYADSESVMTDGYESMFAGAKLKETGYTHWESPNLQASDDFGFKGIGGGHRSSSGTYLNLRLGGYYWSADQADVNNSWYRQLLHDGVTERRYKSDKNAGFSVRCVKD